MNYDAPRQVDPTADRPDAGKWRYTSSNRRLGTFAIGYCAQGCPGHDTEDGAREHQQQYLVDQIRFTEDRPDAASLHRCEAEGCAAFTSGAAVGEWQHWDLCAEHRTREVVSALMGPRAGDSWHS